MLWIFSDYSHDRTAACKPRVAIRLVIACIAINKQPEALTSPPDASPNFFLLKFRPLHSQMDLLQDLLIALCSQFVVHCGQPDGLNWKARKSPRRCRVQPDHRSAAYNPFSFIVNIFADEVTTYKKATHRFALSNISVCPWIFSFLSIIDPAHGGWRLLLLLFFYLGYIVECAIEKLFHVPERKKRKTRSLAHLTQLTTWWSDSSFIGKLTPWKRTFGPQSDGGWFHE